MNYQVKMIIIGNIPKGGVRGKKTHRPVVLSQTLLCVVEMRSFCIKCIDEKLNG